MIVTRTPLRISLFGGGTDLPPYCNGKLSHVISMAIDKYVYCAVNFRNDGQFHVGYSKVERTSCIDAIQHDIVRETLTRYFELNPSDHDTAIERGIEINFIADLPGHGAGLGASSAVSVGLLTALAMLFNNYSTMNVSQKYIAELSYSIDKQLNDHAGWQDHLGCALPGFKHILRDEVGLFTVDYFDDCVYPIIHNYFRLFDTQLRRESKDVLSDVSNNCNYDAMNRISDICWQAHGMWRYLEDHPGYDVIQKISRLLEESFINKLQTSDKVSFDGLEDWENTLKNLGASSIKLLGAGGGGYILCMMKPSTNPDRFVDNVYSSLGMKNVPFKIDNSGVSVAKMEWKY